MKTIKLKFIGNYEGYLPQWSDIWEAMAKHYDIQLVEEDPDYIICDIFGDIPYEYCHYPQIRILVVGENYVPDFNVVDYAVSRYPVKFYDRNFYLPGCAVRKDRFFGLAAKERNYGPDLLQSKEFFASFIASHDSEYNIRGDFFKALSSYKRVESPGSYLYNMDDDTHVRWENDSKINFQRRCKFSLCFESTSHYGFITEKISDAFFADTIPVYYGSPTVGEIFNKKAFIDLSDYASFDEAIAKIIELDNDDEKYMQMMREPVFVDPDYPQKLEKELEAFVCNIFDQPIEKAYRRGRVYYPKYHNDFLVWADDMANRPIKRIRRFLSRKKWELLHGKK